jgi:peptidyl-prolyl cis-trans isomerase B (cyclophilin B)
MIAAGALGLALVGLGALAAMADDAGAARVTDDAGAARVTDDAGATRTDTAAAPATGSLAVGADIETNRGTIRLELFAAHTPQTVANFVNLAQRGFYDGLTFHRVLPRQFVQGGSPTGTSIGGPGYVVDNEFSDELTHSRPGMISMTGGPNGNGCQFFITLDALPYVDGVHTVFGQIVEGQEVVAALAPGDVMTHVEITGDPRVLLERLAPQVAAWNAILDRRAAGQR